MTIDWNQTDAVLLRAYLEQSKGRFLAYLKQVRPSLGGNNYEERVINGCIADGAEKDQQTIIDMANYETTQKKPNAFISVRDPSGAAASKQR